VVVSLGAAIGVNYAATARLMRRSSADRAALLVEKCAAYAWPAHSIPPNERVIAYEDLNIYLYSGTAANETFAAQGKN
jgi:hypothetical protein